MDFNENVLCVAFNAGIYLFLKTSAKVGYQKGFDKKQFIKRLLISKIKINNQNTN